MKYTKYQRHKIYKEALIRYNTFPRFVCFAVEDALGIKGPLPLEDFPELDLFREPNRGGAWLTYIDKYENTSIDTEHGKALRRTVLEFCIEMTK